MIKDKTSNINNVIQKIKNDNSSGSAELTNQILEILIIFIKDSSFKEKKDLKTNTKKLCYKIYKAKSDMASIFNLLNDSVLFLDETKEDDLKNNVLDFFKSYKKNLDESLKKICENSFKIIKNYETVFTHSYTSTVLESIIYAKNKGVDLKVICTESRPIFEGRNFAKILAKNDIETKIIIDSAINMMIKKADVSIVGCDAISKKGIFNKIGTKNLGMASKNNGIELFCLCGTDKILPKNYKPLDEEKKDPDEIWKIRAKNIVPVNFYFEYTPLSYFSKIINEKGFFSDKEIIERIKEKKVHSIFLRKNFI